MLILFFCSNRKKRIYTFETFDILFNFSRFSWKNIFLKEHESWLLFDLGLFLALPSFFRAFAKSKQIDIHKGVLFPIQTKNIERVLYAYRRQTKHVPIFLFEHRWLHCMFCSWMKKYYSGLGLRFVITEWILII